MKILVINGPNINMLGIREPGIYGIQTFQDLLNLLAKAAEDLGIDVEQYQSNHEGCIIDKILLATISGVPSFLTDSSENAL